jgi:hypothetical protein
VVPSANDGLAGVTAIDTNTGCPTLKLAEALNDSKAAVIVVAPLPTPLAKPLEEMVATAVTDELQLTLPLRFCVLPSL